MYQDFETTSATSAVPERIALLRAEMQRLAIDAFLVPRGDEHRGEYVAPTSERLAWLTGFTGSAGFAIIAHDKAALFVDGRYTVQARVQAPSRIFSYCALPAATTEAWLLESMRGQAAVVGYDPWLHPIGEITGLIDKLGAHGFRFKLIARNPIDRIWGRHRPPPPMAPVVVHPLAKAGEAAADKIAHLQEELRNTGQDATVLTAPDSICWLLNIRGSDIAHNPVALCFAIVPQRGKVELFVAPAKLDAAVRAHLAPFAKPLARDRLQQRLKALRAADKRVRVDPNTCPVWIARQLGGPKRIVHGPDLCVLPKAVKNKVEIRGARNAHRRDAVAVCRFLAWLDRAAPAGTVDEISAARQLEAFRAETGKLREISFDTISGSGTNAAVVHYRVNVASNRKLAPGELYLVDSGAQYEDGTTDITRTIAVGRPSAEMRDRFTRVLKGHIAIATAAFPEGTRGIDLDPFARRALWQAGLDYDHGTGHGVGSYLSVHEGPQSISRRGMAALLPGMIISNEPGYYKEGAYGIRIENLVLVQSARTPAGGDRPLLTFETLTLAPIDRRLIAIDLLTDTERDWLDAYHARVLSEIAVKLDTTDRRWLEAACAPL